MIDVDVDETSRRCSTVHVPDLLLARNAAPSEASQAFMLAHLGHYTHCPGSVIVRISGEVPDISLSLSEAYERHEESQSDPNAEASPTPHPTSRTHAPSMSRDK